MIKKFFRKIKNKIKEKTGASMSIVIVAMSMLIILGTTFSTIAVNTYQNSYGSMCRKQALLTSKSVLDGIVSAFKSDKEIRTKIGAALGAELNNVGPNHILDVSAKIPITGLNTNLIDMDGDNPKCYLYASYYDDSKAKLKLTVESYYKGFKDSISAVLVSTNMASVELYKIMSNTLYFTSPIVDISYYADDSDRRTENGVEKFNDYAIVGDIYVAITYIFLFVFPIPTLST